MAFWSVARTLPKREAFAAERLAAGGFETFAPQVKTKRTLAPLFPNYLFVLIRDRWRAVDCTPGVLCLIKFGDTPARCPDAEVARLQSQVNRQGFIRLPDGPSVQRKIAIGSKVRITGGAFAGMSGLYAGQSRRERELVLLNLLGAVRPVAIAAASVVPA